MSYPFLIERINMQSLKITTTAGVSTLVPLDNVLSLTVSAANLITSVTYVNTSGTPTTVAVAAFNGTNDKYEYGHLTEGYIFCAHVANYRTR